MSEITTKAKVECSDGPGGKSTHLIADPESGKLTHVVVKEKHFPISPDRLVPIDIIGDTAEGIIRLQCTREELESMEPYPEIHYVQKDMPGAPYVMVPGIAMTEVSAAMSQSSWVEETDDINLPQGELDVSRDMIVKTGGSKIGKVDGLIVDLDNGKVTHLMMREGHLWEARDVSIPVTAIEHVDDDEVHLNINKQAIEKLPTIPL